MHQMAGDEPTILSHHSGHGTGDMAAGPPRMADMVELDLLEALDDEEDEFFYSIMLTPSPTLPASTKKRCIEGRETSHDYNRSPSVSAM